jgi:putative DNA primase/helicase
MSDIAGLLSRCRANPAPLSAWEAGFLADIETGRRPISMKQVALLERIAIRVEPATLTARLAEHIEPITTHLKGAPPSQRLRDELRYGRRGSFSIVVAGPKRGSFFDHEAGTGGDVLGLIAHLCRCSTAEAIQWSRSWFGSEGLDISGLPATPHHEPPKIILPEPKKTVLARAIWSEAVPPAGTLVEAYLASRGLSLLPGAPLRFHPACPRDRERLPAMIAQMTEPETAAPAGIHRTFLAPDGSGKAPGQAKMMLGAAGVIRLVGDAEVTAGLGITEGIENALAIMSRGWSPVWAAGSAGAIASFPVLAGIESLTIFADADENGAGTKAARTCATRWAAAGRQVDVHYPPSGSDWNDVTRLSSA